MYSLRDGIGDYECHARAACVKMFIVRITVDVVRRHFFFLHSFFTGYKSNQNILWL